MRVLKNLRRKPNDLEKYIFMVSLQDRNETLFYRVVIDNLDELMPIIYTPTVGLACQEYGHIFRRPRGIFVSAQDRGRVADVLRNWPHQDVRIIVVTDGERILGLGDLGANGMGIPVGKLSLYTACAGVHPDSCLPVMLDVGTEQPGAARRSALHRAAAARVRGAAYDEFVDEFVTAVQRGLPERRDPVRGLRQRQRVPSAGSVPRPGVLLQRRHPGHSGGRAGRHCTRRLRVTGGTLAEQTAAVPRRRARPAPASPTSIVTALVARGCRAAEARARCWFVDSKGLVVKSRDRPRRAQAAVRARRRVTGRTCSTRSRRLQPTALIGVVWRRRSTFTQPVVAAMARLNKRPIIFALSNPTSKSECTAEEAYTWSDGRAVFASGSPFNAVTVNGRTYVPGQGNNAYIFPGVGLGVIASRGESRHRRDVLRRRQGIGRRGDGGGSRPRSRLPPNWPHTRRVGQNRDRRRRRGLSTRPRRTPPAS